MAIEEAPELPAFQRCTKFTTMYGTILLKETQKLAEWLLHFGSLRKYPDQNG